MDDLPKTSDVREIEAYKRELVRRSMDRIRVYNPTDKDFVILWGTEKYKYVVPNKNKDMGWGKGMRVLERYLAEKYRRDIKDYMINKMADDELEATKERLEKAGVDNSLWKANTTLEMSGKYKTDNPKLVKECFDKVWLGIEEEFGMDTTEEEDNAKPQDNTLTVEQQIGATMDNKKYVPNNELKSPEVLTQDNTREEIPTPTITEVKYPINKKKKNLVKEVSV